MLWSETRFVTSFLSLRFSVFCQIKRVLICLQTAGINCISPEVVICLEVHTTLQPRDQHWHLPSRQMANWTALDFSSRLRPEWIWVSQFYKEWVSWNEAAETLICLFFFYRESWMQRLHIQQIKNISGNSCGNSTESIFYLLRIFARSVDL
jgi:hypothetical protein